MAVEFHVKTKQKIERHDITERVAKAAGESLNATRRRPKALRRITPTSTAHTLHHQHPIGQPYNPTQTHPDRPIQPTRPNTASSYP